MKIYMHFYSPNSIQTPLDRWLREPQSCSTHDIIEKHQIPGVQSLAWNFNELSNNWRKDQTLYLANQYN
jgi:hypothetical protein